MTRPIIFDGETQREMTVAEHEQWQALCVDVEEQAQAAADNLAAKQSARTKLAALGLTEAEINALVG